MLLLLLLQLLMMLFLITVVGDAFAAALDFDVNSTGDIIIQASNNRIKMHVAKRAPPPQTASSSLASKAVLIIAGCTFQPCSASALFGSSGSILNITNNHVEMIGESVSHHPYVALLSNTMNAGFASISLTNNEVKMSIAKSSRIYLSSAEQ